jgi:hypothetical protein
MLVASRWICTKLPLPVLGDRSGGVDGVQLRVSEAAQAATPLSVRPLAELAGWLAGASKTHSGEAAADCWVRGWSTQLVRLCCTALETPPPSPHRLPDTLRFSMRSRRISPQTPPPALLDPADRLHAHQAPRLALRIYRRGRAAHLFGCTLHAQATAVFLDVVE